MSDYISRVELKIKSWMKEYRGLRFNEVSCTQLAEAACEVFGDRGDEFDSFNTPEYYFEFALEVIDG